ncbi:AI-2E family transporter (plasmid) [Aliirhizobium terrae]|uniref:AI-2E family transporter n=1 Tax=Terrirhizobium terrae TaxID=2926709 RepID=UPI0025789437|nr:AI-2E family transporter [Rhizobium sp. CC-CFT758]WJH38848.1 AI-2E family transporter [Rhizobium sp. CC-CFT758]
MLRSWLKSQLMSMAAVGILTALGLWATGLPLAPLLGIIAALFAFIPDIGPVLAILPALSLTLPDGSQMIALVVAV